MEYVFSYSISLFVFYAAVSAPHVYAEEPHLRANVVKESNILNIKKEIIELPAFGFPVKHTFRNQMPSFRPAPDIDYKIQEIRVNPNIDYKILTIDREIKIPRRFHSFKRFLKPRKFIIPEPGKFKGFFKHQILPFHGVPNNPIPRLRK
ncbi:hypothetical protein ACFL1R_05285 [Candidatus Latescibacterota bacterium]